ncbi:MAG: CPBP family intramembrane metalloprotease [Eubacteriales bacterium]|nr:CPBP family intramembrane metalloprotease [Eubacteriales bacterium]
MVMAKNHIIWKRSALYGIVVLSLLIFQLVLGKIGSVAASSFSYDRLDPHNAFLWISVHHFTEFAIVLPVILLIGKLFKIDFGFDLGDRKKGSRYLAIFTVIFAGVTLVCHILMLLNDMLPANLFPLTTGNILGTLGFQLFLSGPTEELLYRALPIAILVHIFGTPTNKKRGITLETIIASGLFAVAHLKWTLIPFTFEPNPFQILYAFAMGTIQGKAYQDSQSILYPILMHSISNVLMVGTGYLFQLF